MRTVYRADIVGSLLRPAYLKEARIAWEADRISAQELKRIEDRAVDAAIASQEGIGLEIVSDGEMRRLIFTGTLTEAIDGLSAVPSPAWRWHGTTPEDETDFRAPISVTGKIHRRRSPPKSSSMPEPRRANRLK